MRTLITTTLLAGIALVQHSANNTAVGAASVSFELPGPASSGDLMIVVTGWVDPSMYVANAPTDNLGNTYTLVAQQASGAVNSQVIAVWYAQNIDGGPTPSISWSITGGTIPLSIEAAEFSGVDRAQAFTGQFLSALATPMSAEPDAGTLTPAAGSLVFGAMAHDHNVTSDAGPGFTLLDIATDDAMSFNPAIDEYRIVGGAPVPVPIPVTFTLSAIDEWTTIGAVFNAAGFDAGADAGVDAGLDGGVDAGLDGGVDAGFDGGTDAGTDAGVDAGHRNRWRRHAGPFGRERSSCRLRLRPRARRRARDRRPAQRRRACPSSPALSLNTGTRRALAQAAAVTRPIAWSKS